MNVRNEHQQKRDRHTGSEILRKRAVILVVFLSKTIYEKYIRSEIENIFRICMQFQSHMEHYYCVSHSNYTHYHTKLDFTEMFEFFHHFRTFSGTKNIFALRSDAFLINRFG